MIRSMKDSRRKWIGEIPENWRIEKLKFHIRVRNEKQAGLGLTYIALENIVGFDCRYIATDHQYSGDDANIARENDIIFSKLRPYLGKVYKVQSDAYVNTEFVVCQAISISDNYLKWYMISHGFLDIVNSSTYGAKMPRANSDYIKNLQVLLPPIAEQKKIADFLDGKCAEIDELVQTEEKMIEELKAYKQSVITEAVTKGLNPSAPMKDSGIEWIGKIPASWEVGRMKYVADINAPCKDVKQYERISYAPMECIKRGWMECQEISPLESSSGLTTFEENDIVMAKVTPCFENGNIAVAKDLINGVALGSSELFVFRARTVLTEWLFYFLQNSKFTDLAKSTMVGTGGLKRVSPKFVSNYQMGVPSLDEQKQIADYLDEKCAKIDEIIALRTEQINQLKEYKKSLIYEYVTGKKEVV